MARGTGWGFLVVFACAMGASLAHAHGPSKSRAVWRVHGSKATFQVAFDSHDLLDARRDLDRDGDRRLSAAELEAAKTALVAELSAATRLSAGRGAQHAPCTLENIRLSGLDDPIEEVLFEGTAICAADIRRLVLETRYLSELEPPHRSVTTIHIGGGQHTHTFRPDHPHFELDLGEPSRSVSKVLFTSLFLALAALAAIGGIAFALRPREEATSPDKP